MNDPADNPYVQKAEEAIREAPRTVHHLEEFIRKHPIGAALGAIGLGCVLGAVVREMLTPEPTAKERAMGVLEDIQARLAEFMEPVSDRVSKYAEDGMDAIQNGVHSVSKSKTAGRLRNWLS